MHFCNASGLTLLTALAEPLLRAAMVACILPAQNAALQGALSTGLLLTMRGIGPFMMAQLFSWSIPSPFVASAALFVAAALILPSSYS